MKKVLSIALVLLLILSLCACGGTSSSSTSEASSASSSESAAPAADASATYKVGIVNYVDDASLNQIIANLEAELDAKGSELGVKFDYEPYYDNAQADSAVLNQIGANMVANDVDIIVAVATPTCLTMMSAVEDTDIPVIFAAVSDPVGAGIVETMDAPGGNVTGTSDGLDSQALINLMLAANPDLSKVGLLYDTAQDSSTQAIADAKTILDGLGIEYVEKTGSTTDEVLLAAQALAAEGVQTVFTPTDNTIMAAEQAIAEVFTENGIQHYAGADSFALWGGFCGYGVDYAKLGTATGDIVVDVLVNGADPATYPVVTFDNGLVSVNIDTCEALGLNIDDIEAAFSDIATGFTRLETSQEFAG